MSHIHAYGMQCPRAKGIIHLGATSSFVTDNADIIIIKDALNLLLKRLITVINNLSEFADYYKGLPVLGYTHLQPAQLTTLGKRSTMWIYDLLLDVQDIEYILSTLYLRGAKDTTGTQSSFLHLFNGNHNKVKEMENLISEYLEFPKDNVIPISGQTYTRKMDYRVLSLLSGIAQSATKFSNDVRFMQQLKELEEPFGKEQVGSSAMPYKRNPMRCERIGALSRFIINLVQNAAQTTASQWMERTLDDSANRRLTIPQAFLATDAILLIYQNVSKNMVVFERMIEKHIHEELPFMSTVNIIMEGVRHGGDRQQLHEAIRRHSQLAADHIKLAGGENDLLERIAADPVFKLPRDAVFRLMNPKDYIGRAKEQVEDFLKQYIKPLLKKYKHYIQEENIEIKY